MQRSRLKWIVLVAALSLCVTCRSVRAKTAADVDKARTAGECSLMKASSESMLFGHRTCSESSRD